MIKNAPPLPFCRPAGQYTVTDSERIKKNTTSFESSCGSANQYPRQTPPPVVQACSQTDAGTTPPVNHPTQFGVTVSVMDTASMGRDQPPAVANSLKEEFDHLENLVSTLNRTVTSMAGTHSGGGDGSNTSIVINNSGAFPEYAMVRKVAAKSGASYAMNVSSRGGNFPYRSSSVSTDESPPPLPRPFSVEDSLSPLPRPLSMGETGSEGSENSIIKENLVALFDEEEPRTRHYPQSHSYSRNTHTGSDSSLSTGGEVKLEGAMGSGFHSDGTLEGRAAASNEVEFDQNLAELLKYGNSVDLTMV